MAEHHVENAPAVVELLEENGGFCDCEVLSNAMDRLLTDEGEGEGENVDREPNPSAKMYQLRGRFITRNPPKDELELSWANG